MTLDELRALLPPNQSAFISTGALPDGRYFAPRYRYKYFCVFENRNAYIYYFVEHYFSHTNIGRSGAIRALMASQNSVPLEKVVMASRLASVNVTESELSAVIRTYSNDLAIVTDSHGRCSVRRKDNFDGNVYLV
ncbi:unnamed protein product [Hymenolepis diminuta]|uniref:Uncharacterized protein n=1 Tax=Hymenolepis diminuta TaxID=6216 RepID=A0A564YCD4_HYMDI|nr:unnamed protein product [Hymenolepis diminuta]